MLRLEGVSKTENYSVRRDAWLIVCLSVSREWGRSWQGIASFPVPLFSGIIGDDGVKTTSWGKNGGVCEYEMYVDLNGMIIMDLSLCALGTISLQPTFHRRMPLPMYSIPQCLVLESVGSSPSSIPLYISTMGLVEPLSSLNAYKALASVSRLNIPSFPSVTPVHPNLIKRLVHKLMCQLHAQKCRCIRWNSPGNRRCETREESLHTTRAVQSLHNTRNGWVTLHSL